MLADWTEDDVYRIAERAHSLYLQGRYREAAVIFEGLVAIDPSNAYCRNALAALYLLLDEPQRALAELNDLLAREPGNAAARARRCEAWLRLGQPGEARRDLDWLAGGRTHSHAARLRLLLESPGAAQLGGSSER
jgi:predicted Zn-dependent protease